MVKKLRRNLMKFWKNGENSETIFEKKFRNMNNKQVLEKLWKV